MGAGTQAGESDRDDAFDPDAVLRMTPATSQDYGPVQIQIGNSMLGWITQHSILPEDAGMIPPGYGGRSYMMSLLVEETQELEFFGLLVPDSDPNLMRPLLTAFHGFSSSHRDIDVRTNLYAEADQRDWFLVAPLQRNLSDPAGNHFDISYASAQSQLHVEAVVQFVLDNYNVDRDRVYGIGFSMGGGNALSYAARNRDRRRGAFAAVVNHTGTVALGDEYANLPSASPVRGIMETIFGGDPVQTPFEWQRSSLLEFDASGTVDPQGRHMAVNLESVPVLSWYNQPDALAHLLNQTDQLHGFLMGLPLATSQLMMVNLMLPGCDQGHCWATLDETFACDWLAMQTLNRFPTSGQVLADRDARWNAFDVDQQAAGAFTSFGFAADSTRNRMEFLDSENLARVSFAPLESGLSLAVPLEVAVTNFPAGVDADLELRAVRIRPTSVLRAGAIVSETCTPISGTSSWCYDTTTNLLTLHDAEGGTAVWEIIP